MVWLFWISAAFLAYTLAGYPAILLIMSRVRNRVHRRSTIWPSITVIIPAHNEGAMIHEKIANTLQLDYPADKLEILVASDGSTDDTVDVIRSFAATGVQLVELKEPHGKHYAQMLARERAKGEIIVFTDAGVLLDPDALQKMASNFADPSVGCVSSEDRILTSASSKSGEGSYVGFEMWLRRLESRVGSLVSASGSFFAARKELCEVWHSHQSSDFFVPLHVAEKRLRSVVDPECIGYYGVTRKGGAEFQRKVRTIVHGLDVAFSHRRVLNPFQYPVFSWQLFSHKFCRWLIPFGLLGLFIASAALWQENNFYRSVFLLQAALYGAGLLALASRRLLALKATRLAGFFLLANAATLTAWMKFCSGEKFVSWRPTQRS
ncbi:MAG: glycosyltransferase family 2 protein [Candidatus Korobacteraceae bacterium]